MGNNCKQSISTVVKSIQGATDLFQRLDNVLSIFVEHYNGHIERAELADALVGK